jgi:hypothetical protein
MTEAISHFRRYGLEIRPFNTESVPNYVATNRLIFTGHKQLFHQKLPYKTEISVYHGGECTDGSFWVVVLCSPVRSSLAFHRYLLPPSSGCTKHEDRLQHEHKTFAQSVHWVVNMSRETVKDQQVLNKQCSVVWTGFILLRMGSSGRLCTYIVAILLILIS